MAAATPEELDPTFNVRAMVKTLIDNQTAMRDAEIKRIDHNIEVESERLDEKFKDGDVKYQIQFNAAKEALGIALIAQEKAVAAALDSTKEAIGKAEIATDKRFDLLSEKIDGVNEVLNKNTGAQGIYVTHTDLKASMDKLEESIQASLLPVVTFMNSQVGQQKGVGATWQIVITVVSVIIALISVSSRFIKVGS